MIVKCVIFSVACALTCGLAGAAQAVDVRGVVRFHPNGADASSDAAGWSIWLRSTSGSGLPIYEAETIPMGRYIFRNVAPGAYYIVADAQGHLPKQQGWGPIHVTDSANVTVPCFEIDFDDMFHLAPGEGYYQVCEPPGGRPPSGH